MAKNSQLLVDVGQGMTLALGLPTIATWETKSRPQDAKRGTIGFNIETQTLECFDGKSWFGAQLKNI